MEHAHFILQLLLLFRRKSKFINDLNSNFPVGLPMKSWIKNHEVDKW